MCECSYKLYLFHYFFHFNFKYTFFRDFIYRSSVCMSLQQQQGPSSSTIATGGQFPITADEAEFSASFSAIFSQSSFLNNQSCGNLNESQFTKLEVVNQQPPQQQSNGGNSAKFILPELKVNNSQNHNNNNGGSIDVNQQQDNKEALSEYDRQQQQIEIAIAAAINGGSSSTSDSPDRNGTFNNGNDEFMRRLIDAVKREPCLYNPSHEHYGNKHASAQYRTAIWQRLCKELDYGEDYHSLQTQWKRIRDRYVRERRRRRILPIEMDPPNSIQAKTYNMMRWIDDYLGEQQHQHSHSPANVANNIVGGNVLMHMPSTSGADQYFEQQNNCINGTIGYGLKAQQRLGLQGAHNNKGVKKNHNESNGSPSSTSSEISVGSAQFAATANNSQILLPQLRHIPAAGPNNTNGGTNFGGRSSHQLMYKMKEEIGVHHQNEVQMGTADAGGGGQLSSYQIISIPPSNAIQLQNDGSGNNYYQQQHGGAQNNSTSSAITNNGTAQPPRRKRAALEGQMHSGGGGQQQQRGGRGGAHLEPERIVVNQPTHMQPVVVHPAQQIHPNQQTSNNDRAVSTSALRLAPIVGRTNAPDSAAQIQSTSTAGQLAQPQYILSTTQPQTPYATDQESAFIEMIVRHLRNLNEDEKVVTKMNIQRILMDARFGRGACVRMFNDELAMEQQRHMQQQHSSVNNSRR